MYYLCVQLYFDYSWKKEVCRHVFFIRSSFTDFVRSSFEMDFIQWNSTDVAAKVEVNCFLPTGVLVPIMSTLTTCFLDIKAQLFEEAQRYPLFNKLPELEPTKYNFMYISSKGKREMVDNERLTLRDVRPFRPFLKLVAQRGIREKELVDSKIRCLMGTTRAIEHHTDNIETTLFRRTYAELATEISAKRQEKEWHIRAMCAYPVDLCDDFPKLPRHITSKLEDGYFLVSLCKLTDPKIGENALIFTFIVIGKQVMFLQKLCNGGQRN
ncbi:phosphatidylinositol 4,5-bisphosphate 3-kinase catalytic subunit alpha isoform-like [Xenia sp. Carnegie-2017]|uniref:phosphatidylinositol 4,5-bisphosphate 3-kinase catalytic subunit alpha isoform-like n=1 Tax=Xenia sp. Carnegie-2017 TaxID=2897299 RepID=UPI001F03952E|nr:phosphatidylinositol 4,5-bisphosphate 3-kinase catalytic subunit alpha isoform-like [Xenia sp. Carnegie-2017]